MYVYHYLNFSYYFLILLRSYCYTSYDKKGIVLCIVIIVLMVIQNKIISQFADTEHIHKKTEVLLTLALYQTSIGEIYG